MFEDSLNELLSSAYRSIERLESQMLRTSKSFSLSISEMHLLEAVAAFEERRGASISEISERLDISLPSVTLGVNKLMRKGYLTKRRSQNDKRVVRVYMTRLGRRAARAHRYFHRTMARSLGKDMSESEKKALLDGISKIEVFLNKKIRIYEEMP